MIEKIKKVQKRHGKAFLYSLILETYIRLYKKKYFRFFLKMPFKSQSPDKTVFVLGCYNSGTTMLKDILDLYSEISTAPFEGDRLCESLSSLESRDWPRAAYGNIGEVLVEMSSKENIKANFLSDFKPWIKSDTIFLEKSISNAFRIKKLKLSFPKAKFICLIRNPEDVINGILKRSKPLRYAQKILEEKAYSVKFLEKQWCFFYKSILRESNKENLLVCSYEKIIECPQEELKKIDSFLGLPEKEVTFQGNELTLNHKSICLRSLKNKRTYIDSIEKLENIIKELDEKHAE